MMASMLADIKGIAADNGNQADMPSSGQDLLTQ